MMAIEKRNTNLDVNRLMACTAVVGLHTFKCNISAANSVIYYLCSFAIPFFFMSSGYILLNRDKLTFQYFSKKVMQILGVVVTWNVLLYICKLIYRLLTHQEGVGITELFFMIGGSLIQRDTMSHFWYMGSLIIVYFLACVLSQFSLQEKQKRVLWICLAVMCIGIQIVSLLVCYSVQEKVIQTFRLWTYFQYFVLGGLMPGFIVWIRNKISLYLHTAFTVFWGALIPIYGLFNGRLNPHAEYLYDDIILMIGVILFFSLIMRIKVSEKAACMIQKLMPYTMGVYIIHILVIKLMVHFIPLNSFLSSCAVFIITLSVSFAAGFCISKVPVLCRLIKL